MKASDNQMYISGKIQKSEIRGKKIHPSFLRFSVNLGSSQWKALCDVTDLSQVAYRTPWPDVCQSSSVRRKLKLSISARGYAIVLKINNNSIVFKNMSKLQNIYHSFYFDALETL